jgi:threonine synthase
MAKIDYFECSKCGRRMPPDAPPGVCANDGGTFWVRYDLERLKHSFSRALLAGRPASMWRYAEVLPEAAPVTLGEGFTPLLRSRRYPNVWIKDEGLNPTGSFKARGLSAAVTMARAWGKRKLAIPSAGNAASALAAYAAAAELEAHIFMPRDVPLANRVECQAYGAQVTLVEGLISDCARLLQQQAEAEGWYDVSTLKEPFRVEGKKTMAYEVAEQMGWRLPDAIIYPTGGGVGLIGMWKALAEMEALGWTDGKQPKMVAVQSAGCAPIPKAFHEGKKTAEAWPQAATIAAGLRVPKAYGDYLILDILRESQGTAVAVSDAEIMAAVVEWAREDGVFAAPEGAASLAAYKKLRAQKWLAPEETVVLFNTGSGLKYLDVIGEALGVRGESPQPPGRTIGGIIGPY